MPDSEWLRGLRRGVEDDAAWIGAIGNAEDAAVLGLLQARGIPDPGLRLARIEVIAQERLSGGITTDILQSWRRDILDTAVAVDGLDDFDIRRPLLSQFCVDHGIPTGNLEPMRQAVRDAIWQHKVSLQEWVEYLDEKRHLTDRELFLFRLPVGDDLQAWQDADFFIQRAADSGLAGGRRFVWRATKPELVGIDADAARHLVTFRWVGWRRWGSDQEPHEKRCMTFVRMNTSSGELELQLQRFDAGGMSSLVSERDTYVKEFANLYGVRPEPVHLEPAMRALLTDTRLALSSWKVRLPNEGELSGKGEPGLFQKAKFGFQRFYALELKGQWTGDAPPSPIPVVMNARMDVISLHTQCDPSAADHLTGMARRKAEEAPPPAVSKPSPIDQAVPDTSAARDLSEIYALLEKILEYQQRLGRTDIAVSHASQTSNDLLFSPAALRTALDRVGVQAIGAMLYVVCPGTKTPVHQDGNIVLFQRPGDIPERLSCDNETGDPRLHLTQDNIFLKVGHDAIIPGTAPTKVAVGITALIVALTITYAILMTVFEERQTFLTVAFMIVLIPALAPIAKIYGPTIFKVITDFLKSVFTGKT